MKKSNFSSITVSLLAIVCIALIINIAKSYIIPLINGTIADLPQGKIYTIDDVPKEIQELIDFEDEKYAYSQLSDNMKEAYRRLLMGVCSYADRVDIKECDLTLEELKTVYSCMRNDYPELFWVFNNCEVYSSGIKVTDCLPEYIYSEKDMIKHASDLNTIKDAILKKVDGMSEYEKVMFVFDYLIDNTEYDMSSYNDYMEGEVTAQLELACGIYGTLMGSKALCEGYSKTTQFLLNNMDIDCLYITGTSKGEGHAWNYVKLDGSYYALDVTWCDPRGEDDVKSYAYCLLDYASFARSHTEDVPYELPLCNGGKYNYYSYNGYALSTFNYKDIKAMLYRAYVEGRSFVEIYCTSQTVYDSFVTALSSQDIFQCFEEIKELSGKNYNTINYGLIDDAWTIRINL